MADELSYTDLDGTKTTVWRLKDGDFGITIRRRTGSSASAVVSGEFARRLAEMLKVEDE